MIHWPAILCFNGDADLVYIPDQAAWEGAPHLQGQSFHPEDRLIDSSGNSFILARIDGKVIPQPTRITIGLDEVLDLVRRHAAQDGACCVAKLSAASIAEAIAMVA